MYSNLPSACLFARLSDRLVSPMFQSLLVHSVLGAILSMAGVAYANNPPPSIKAEAPNRYVVQKGDTLWDISGRYLQAPYRWREIWATNKQLSNPHLIYPGDVLLLCIIQGKTLVGVDTGEGCAGVEKQLTTPAASQTVTLTSTANSIPPIPLAGIQTWLDRTTIVNPADFNTTPYVLASKKRNLLNAKGDKIYVKGVPLIVGQRYGIYRKGEPYLDSETNQLLGLEVTQVASGLVTNVASNGISSIQLTETHGYEVRKGDRVFVEIGKVLPPVFYPTAATVERAGEIIRVLDSISSAGKGSVVAINLGSNHGAKPGAVLTVYRQGALVQETRDNDNLLQMPREAAGMVMVFNSFANLSYAYVLSAELPLNVGDQLLPPPYL